MVLGGAAGRGCARAASPNVAAPIAKVETKARRGVLLPAGR